MEPTLTVARVYNSTIYIKLRKKCCDAEMDVGLTGDLTCKEGSGRRGPSTA